MERVHSSQRAAGIKFALKSALLSIRDALLPGYILLSLAALMVAAYYHMPSVAGFLSVFARLKAEWGFVFSFACTGFFGGVMTWAFRMAFPLTRPSRPWLDLAFLLLLWGGQGVCIDALYRGQGLLFGVEASFSVVVFKVLVDQFGYSAFFSAPLNAVAYYWNDSGYSFRAVRASFGKGWYVRMVLPTYLVNMIIWLPGVSIVYSLPADLQIFMAGLISCFFSLICTYVAVREKAHQADGR